MANVIKISDDVYEEMRKNKPEDKSMQEYASEILKAGLKNNSLITADENFEKQNRKDEVELKQKFDDMYENINEILEKVSLNYDRLYGKNGTDQYIIQPRKVVKNVMPLKKLTEEEVKQLTADIRKKPGFIPWDKLDRILLEEKRKENEKMEHEKRQKQEDNE
ncbi:MAG: hypothetical protein ACLUWE_03815 [Lachnospira sp.]|jgi:predicted CopG family antitoxin